MAASVGERLRLRLLHWSFLVARPMTLGVRGIVINPDDEILLVRHGYVSGWHFPGGGVEVGETFVESLTRELEEEARIAIEGPPVLHGLFFNTQTSRRDHVAALRCSELPDFRRTQARLGNRRSAFFPAPGAAGGNDAGDSSEARRDLRCRSAFRSLVTSRAGWLVRAQFNPIALISSHNFGREDNPLTDG